MKMKEESRKPNRIKEIQIFNYVSTDKTYNIRIKRSIFD